MNQALSDYTNDLVVQRNQIQSDIQNFEKIIGEKKAVLVVLDNLLKQAQQRVNGQEAAKKKSTTISADIPSPTVISSAVRDFAMEIMQFLSSQPWQQARTSDINKALMSKNKEDQQKVSNTINQLCKQWKVVIMKEYDAQWVERQRNRLYQITSRV